VNREVVHADDKVDRQSRILEAAVRLLSRHGISGLSMRSVAREAGVALGLVNYYFADKASLIRAALHRIEDVLQNGLWLSASLGLDPASIERRSCAARRSRRLPDAAR
jgi:AcrR family transcriptional regulator